MKSWEIATKPHEKGSFDRTSLRIILSAISLSTIVSAIFIYIV